MSDDSKLVIKIGGDPSEFKAAATEAVASGEALNHSFEHMSEIAGEIFEKLIHQIEGSFEAFKEEEQATRALNQGLQNQGIYTDELASSYREYAEVVQKATGIQTAQTIEAQVAAQAFLGQIPITQELTNAIADYSTKNGSLKGSAEAIAKAVSTGTGELVRQGLVVNKNATEQERLGQVLKFVEVRYGGQAAAANQGLGSVKGLTAAIHDQQAELGERFAPAMTAVIGLLTDFITPSKEGAGTLTDLKAAALATGLVLAGLGIVLPIVAQGFLAVRAAAVALEIGAAPIIGIAVAVVAVGTAIVLLATHWKQVSATVTTIVKELVTTISTAFSGLKEVLDGAFHLDGDKIKAGLDKIGGAFKGIATDAVEAWKEAGTATEKGLATQDLLKKKAADKEASERKRVEEAQRALRKAEQEAIQLELNNASERTLQLKKQEIFLLKELADKKGLAELALVRKQLAEVRQLEAENTRLEVAQDKQFGQIIIDAKKTLGDKIAEQNKTLDKKELAQLKAKLLTQETAERAAFQKELERKIAENNKFLSEQEKYGTAYAAINEIMHSEQFEGAKAAFGDLSELTQSKNAELKEIGKVAAVADIAIKTAQAAMNIYSGFATIPIIGVGLGIAGAAAAVAYGGEKIADVYAAYDGGVVQGGSPYQDSVPAFLSRGELITPTRSYDETVNAVAAERNRQAGPGKADSQNVNLLVTMKGDVGEFVEAKLIQRQRSGTSLIKAKL